ncbi:3-ketoacyl-ACP reductase [Halolactibacillus alkaliphilus]|uniref:3-ketoacyl-ACP reductase n=1 Tax=Halolactibacillus alkaliphilus TaxID=442899 RepID=A0A511X4D8_9BACI|nr:SDR family oxidoreductase [Halolactibacillus alkaliphilus]GEN57806.1 3-ketoacyl-ACP reductase [Halolactibacillus alkaliphilus]GGN75154.1 3-ketoacyl-ACP reductase [Halolactibacillus alkaliphilus]
MSKKHVLIIGASGAIGQQIVKDLSEKDYSFSLHYHKGIERLTHQLASLPKESVFEVVQGDLSTPTGIASFIKQITFTPDAIVFAQGQASYGLLTDLTSQDMTALLSVHVESLWRITQHFLPAMIKKRHGEIVVISSIWGECGASYEVAYSTVKGAQIAFVKALAKEVGPSRVRVNAVTPGFIDTTMNQQLSNDERLGLLEDIPLGRLGEVRDVSHLVRFLLADESSYVTGEVMRVSGGWHI